MVRVVRMVTHLLQLCPPFVQRELQVSDHLFPLLDHCQLFFAEVDVLKVDGHSD